MLSTNKERVVATLISRGPMHRADLARALGVSRTTVTNLVATLLEAGLVEEEPGDGLKSKLFVSGAHGVLVSVVFRIRETMAAVGSPDGRILAFDTRPVSADAPGSQRLQGASSMLVELLDGLGGPDVDSAHVAVNTQVDTRSGAVLGGEASSMWAGHNPRDELARVLGGARVELENTARLMGLVEHLAEHERANNLVYVSLARGVTLGQVLLGRIIQGSHGGAGELGHVSIDPEGPPCACANKGCLMQYVGEAAVLARAEAILGPGATITDLVTAAHDGSHACRSVITDVGVSLGRALVAVCNLMDPDVISIGGDLAAAGDLLVDPVERTVRDYALPLVTTDLRVVTAEASTDPRAVVGAGIHILREDATLVREIVRARLADS